MKNICRLFILICCITILSPCYVYSFNDGTKAAIISAGLYSALESSLKNEDSYQEVEQDIIPYDGVLYTCSSPLYLSSINKQFSKSDLIVGVCKQHNLMEQTCYTFEDYAKLNGCKLQRWYRSGNCYTIYCKTLDGVIQNANQTISE